MSFAGWVNDAGGGDVGRAGIEAEAGQLDGGVRVADIGLQTIERLVVGRAFDDGEVGDDARILSVPETWPVAESVPLTGRSR